MPYMPYTKDQCKSNIAFQSYTARDIQQIVCSPRMPRGTYASIVAVQELFVCGTVGIFVMIIGSLPEEMRADRADIKA